MSYRLKLLLLFAFIADRDKSSFRFSPLILFPKLRKLCESQGPCPITWNHFPSVVHNYLLANHFTALWSPFELQNLWLVSICNWKKGLLFYNLLPALTSPITFSFVITIVSISSVSCRWSRSRTMSPHNARHFKLYRHFI